MNPKLVYVLGALAIASLLALAFLQLGHDPVTGANATAEQAQGSPTTGIVGELSAQRTIVESELPGFVQGCVLYADSHPSPGIEVGLYSGDPAELATTRLVSQTSSDSRGFFGFDETDAQDLFVAAVVPGFRPTVARARPGAHDLVLRLVAERAETEVVGFVADTEGHPLSAFDLAVRYSDGKYKPLWSERVERSPDGRFVCYLPLLNGLTRPVEFLVSAVGHVASDRTIVEVVPGESPSAVHIMLELAAVTWGFVNDPDGNPIAGARVQPYQGRFGAPGRSVVTDARGRFDLARGQAQDLSSVVVEAKGYAPRWVRESASTHTSWYAKVITLDQGGRISGIVLDAGDNPVVNQVVVLWTDDARESGLGWFPAWQRAVRTDATGFYQFEHTPIGALQIGIRNESGSTRLEQTQPVHIARAGDAEEVMFIPTLVNGIAVHGRVDFEVLGKSTCVWIEIRKPASGEHPARALARWQGTNRSRFELTNLALEQGASATLRIALTPDDYIERELHVDSPILDVGTLQFDAQALLDFNRGQLLVQVVDRAPR